MAVSQSLVARTQEGERVLIKVNSHIVEARREMRVMKVYGRMDHLVELLDYQERDGKAIIVMEWIPGKTLNALIQQHGAFPPHTVVTVTEQVLKGLQSLHGLGYVHGDVHGGNVMVDGLEEPNVTLIDMQMAVYKGRAGVAKARRKLRNPPAHLPPESTEVWIDDRYDIYGVGFMMASMLLGKVIKKRVGGWDSDERNTPLWAVVRRAIQTDPAERYPNVLAMAADLRSASREMGIDGDPRRGLLNWGGIA